MTRLVGPRPAHAFGRDRRESGGNKWETRRSAGRKASAVSLTLLLPQVGDFQAVDGESRKTGNRWKSIPGMGLL